MYTLIHVRYVWLLLKRSTIVNMDIVANSSQHDYYGEPCLPEASWSMCRWPLLKHNELY